VLYIYECEVVVIFALSGRGVLACEGVSLNPAIPSSRVKWDLQLFFVCLTHSKHNIYAVLSVPNHLPTMSIRTPNLHPECPFRTLPVTH
jgi:hypothetical protein